MNENSGQPTSTALPRPSFTKWTSWDFIRWAFLPEALGGGEQFLLSYKDAWIIYNRSKIQDAARTAKVPVELLAGIAWNEVGGMPDFLDHLALPIRSFDWSGPDFLDRRLTITKDPGRTSFGSVSIQLRIAAETMGLDIRHLGFIEREKLARALDNDTFNLNIVARHVFDLIRYDYPNIDTANLSDEQIAVVGSRYNRGTSRKVEEIISSLKAAPGDPTREYSSYGRTILRRRDRVRSLLFR